MQIIACKKLKILIDGVEEGAKRTAEIVQGLKNFSRIDESESNLANVHDLLDSTLIVLRNLTKKNTTVVKHYDPSMETIKCFPGKLNQVFSNIIVNAVHATQHKTDAKIEITTQNLSQDIVVRISDNGTGIPESVKAKIFDPFFTTKDVGEGTGLGLSIVYSIINQHHGQLDVETEVGKGTTFIITIPKD